ncbi:hypothetical protein FRC09_016335 [Ceratobasidium sp. 395]|nr:hypothetical protein FRC09_016335 [Ceratobasidium sp. 395]
MRHSSITGHCRCSVERWVMVTEVTEEAQPWKLFMVIIARVHFIQDFTQNSPPGFVQASSFSDSSSSDSTFSMLASYPNNGRLGQSFAIHWLTKRMQHVTFFRVAALAPSASGEPHGNGNIKVWGAITSKGVGHLYRIDGILTGARYTEISQDALLGTLDDYKLSTDDVFFQQDNDPKHTSRVAQKWLSDNSIDVLPWPASSPDLNIIEHVWDYLDQKVRAQPQLPRNHEDLWRILQEEWHCIPHTYISDLYVSIPAQIQAVLAAKGGNTRY